MRFFVDAPLWRSALLILPTVIGCSALLDAIEDIIRAALHNGSVTRLLVHGLINYSGALVAAAIIRAQARTRSVSSTEPAV